MISSIFTDLYPIRFGSQPVPIRFISGSVMPGSVPIPVRFAAGSGGHRHSRFGSGFGSVSGYRFGSDASCKIQSTRKVVAGRFERDNMSQVETTRGFYASAGFGRQMGG